MTYRLISLSGLIHVYHGEAKEYIPMPTVGFYDTTDAEDAHRLDVAMNEHRKFESQCVLVEDQERAKEILNRTIWDSIPKGDKTPENIHPQDRTLYTVEAPEMERVEQLQRSDGGWITVPKENQGKNFGKISKTRTVMRFKSEDTVTTTEDTGTYFPEAKESQEELWAEAFMLILSSNDSRDSTMLARAKFHITRKP